MLRKPSEFLSEKQWKSKVDFMEMHGFQQMVRKQSIKNMPGVGQNMPIINKKLGENSENLGKNTKNMGGSDQK